MQPACIDRPVGGVGRAAGLRRHLRHLDGSVQRMAAGASRIREPLARRLVVDVGSTGTPVSSKRDSCSLVVMPMSKQRPFEDR